MREILLRGHALGCFSENQSQAEVRNGLLAVLKTDFNQIGRSPILFCQSTIDIRGDLAVTLFAPWVAVIVVSQLFPISFVIILAEM